VVCTARCPEELIDEHGNYDVMFQRLLGENAFNYQSWAVVDNQHPPDIHAADAWLITGSKHGVYENHPWIAPLEKFIQEAYAADIPIVGICFGHQILAQALGGKVVKFDGGWSVGRVNYDLENSADSEDRKSSAMPDARVIGSTDFCRYAGLAYGKTALSLQPHPEFDSAFVGALIETRGRALPDDLKATARSTLEQPLAREPVAKMLREFLQRSGSDS